MEVAWQFFTVGISVSPETPFFHSQSSTKWAVAFP